MVNQGALEPTKMCAVARQQGCGGQVRVIACIEDPGVIGRILAHLEARDPAAVGEGMPPAVRGPPVAGLEVS